MTVDFTPLYDLGKWPRLIVAGEPVTPEQANEILLRTDSWWLTSNDRTWTRTVAEVAGIELDEHGFERWESVEAFRQRIGALGLEYLVNERIVSSWIGGPHGWCDWDGQIGCSTHNIGKYPTHEEVLAEWQRIATAFPYLDLTARLVTEEGEGQPAVDYRVHGGLAHAQAPVDSDLPQPRDPSLIGLLSWPADRERGVTAQRLRKALDQVVGGSGGLGG